MNLTILVIFAAAGAGVALLWYLFQRWPVVGLVFWLIAVCFMPVWWAVRISLDWRPAIVAGIILLATFFGRLPQSFTAGDLGVGMLFMAGVFPMLFGGASASSVFGLASQWMLGFLLGRLALLRLGEDLVYRIIVVMLTIVAVLALVEFAFDWHPWSLIGPNNQLYSIWGGIQGRGGLSRAEGAFGHSIALGCVFALTLPFVLAANLKARTRFALSCLMVGATLVTLSRAALLSAGLSLLLIVVFGGRAYGAESRRTALMVVLVGALVTLPALSSVLAAAGDEAGRSAEYRGRLLDLIAAMEPLGLSGQGRTQVNGERYIGKFQSIDSQFILTGITYGWIVLLLGLALLLLAAGVVIVGRASPGIIAIVGQTPALASVALITQYNIYFWFVAGLGVAALAKYNQEDSDALAASERWRTQFPLALSALNQRA